MCGTNRSLTRSADMRLTKGDALIQVVETTIRDAAAGQLNLSNVRERLQFLFNDFSSSFHAWKTQDLSVIVDVMVGSFVNLDLIIQSTKDDTDGNVAQDYLEAVRKEQTKKGVRDQERRVK